MSDERRLTSCPGVSCEPFTTLDRMRTEGPVVRLRLPIVGRTWLAGSHESCRRTVEKQPGLRARSHQRRKQDAGAAIKVLPRTLGLLASNMLGHDDPEHRRLR